MDKEDMFAEAKEDFERLKNRILQVKDEDKKREALMHLDRMKELLNIKGNCKKKSGHYNCHTRP